MANINLCKLVMIDNWPGQPNTNLGVPANGWDSTRWNYKTTASTDKPPYPFGTKIQAYTDNTNCPGWYTMIYLSFHEMTTTTGKACISADFSDGCFYCGHIGQGCASHSMWDASSAPYFVVANCYTTITSDLSIGGAMAIPCATMNSDGTEAATTENGYGDAFGWFWCGGVCPCKDVTLLQGTAGSLLGACVTAANGRGLVYCATLQTGTIPVSDVTGLPFAWASACAE